MAPVVGIDLGTTNSVIAAVRSGKPFVLPNAEGGRITPSVVSFAADGTYVAGEPARRRAVMFPDATVFSIKRLMGRAFADPNVQSDRRNLPYRVVEGAGGAAWVEVHGRRYSPPEISAIILQKLILDGEAYLGEPIREAVITIPAYFNEKQLQATKDAGMIAGLNVMRVVNEPTAAALAYGLERQADERVLVFSLGGGSMDVSALELGRGVFEVKATMGDTHLGGDDLDWHIVAWLCTEFRTRTGIDLAQNAAAFERLKAAAELAKIDLSSAREAEINLPYIAADANGPHHIHTTLTRQQFNELIAPLLIRIEPPLKQVIGQAWGSYNAADILDDIVLVGGQTRTPAIGDTVQRVLNKVPRHGVDPDEAVALGAAIQAGVMSGAFRDTLLLDVFPFDLCVETASVGDDRSERPPLPLPATPATEPRQPSPAGAPWQYRLLEPLIQPADLARQSTTFTTSRLFTTDQDQQTTAVIQLWYEEEGQSAVPLGRLMLEGMAPEPRGRARIAVQLDIDLDRTVTMTVRDTANPHMQPLTVRSVIPLIQNGGNSHELATAQLTHLSIETAALGTYGERPPLPLPATPAADPSSPLPGGVPRQYRLLEQIVAANTTVPTQKSDVFTTDQDQQTTAIIRLVRFRAPMGDDGVTLGQVMLEGMAPEPRGRARIAVQLDIDANRTITMTVRDRANDREQRLTVHTPSAWGPEDMGRLAAEADARAQRARAVRREQETRDAAVGEASAAEKLLREPSIGLSTEARARIERLAGEIRAAGTQVDLAEIEGQRRALREALYAVADESFRPIQAFGTSLFVSHSHGDNEYCREFVRALREAQANVWYDEDDLPSGELTPKIEAELIARPIFIPMLSPAALQSTWVLKEARRFHELYTRDTRRIIIPVLAAALGGETEIWDFLRDFKRIDGGHLRPYPARDAAHFTLQALTQAAR